MNALRSVVRAISPFLGRSSSSESTSQDQGDKGIRGRSRSASGSSRSVSLSQPPTPRGGGGGLSSNPSSNSLISSQSPAPSRSTRAPSDPSLPPGAYFDDNSEIDHYSSNGKPGIAHNNSNKTSSSSNNNNNNNINNKNSSNKENVVNSSQQPVYPADDDWDLENVDFTSLLSMFYVKYNPSKMNTIDQVLEEYRGDEGELIDALKRRYNVSDRDMERMIGKCRNNFLSGFSAAKDDTGSTTASSSRPTVPSRSHSQEDMTDQLTAINIRNLTANDNKNANVSNANNTNSRASMDAETDRSDDNRSDVGLQDMLLRSNSNVGGRLDKRVLNQMQSLQMTDFDIKPKDDEDDGDNKNSLFSSVGAKNASTSSKLQAKIASPTANASRSSSVSPSSDSPVARPALDLNDLVSTGLRPVSTETFEKILDIPPPRKVNLLKTVASMKSALKSPGVKSNPLAMNISFSSSNPREIRFDPSNQENKIDNQNLSGSLNGTENKGKSWAALSQSIRKSPASKGSSKVSPSQSNSDMNKHFINWVQMRRLKMQKYVNLLSSKQQNAKKPVGFLMRLQEFVNDPKNQKTKNSKSSKRIWIEWKENMERKKANNNGKSAASRLKMKTVAKAKSIVKSKLNSLKPNNPVESHANVGVPSEMEANNKLSLPEKKLVNDAEPIEVTENILKQPRPKTAEEISSLVLNPLCKSNFKINRPYRETSTSDSVEDEKQINKELAAVIADGRSIKASLIESLCRGEAMLQLVADILEKSKMSESGHGKNVHPGVLIEKFLTRRGFPAASHKENCEDEHIMAARLLAAMKNSKFTNKCVKKYKNMFLTLSEISEYNEDNFLQQGESSSEEEDIADDDDDGNFSDPEEEKQTMKQVHDVTKALATQDLMKLNIESQEMYELQSLNNLARKASNEELLFNVSTKAKKEKLSNINPEISETKRGDNAASGVNSISSKNDSRQVNGQSETKKAKAQSFTSTGLGYQYYNGLINPPPSVDMKDLETISTVLKVNYDLPTHMNYTEAMIHRIVPDTKQVPIITTGGLLSPNKKAIKANIIKREPSRFLHINSNEKFNPTIQITKAQKTASGLYSENAAFDPNYFDSHGNNIEHLEVLNELKSPKSRRTSDGFSESAARKADQSHELPEETMKLIARNFNSITSSQNSQKQLSPNSSSNKNNVPRSVSRTRMTSFNENNSNKPLNDWQSKVDPKTSRTYYYSPSRRATCWNPSKYDESKTSSRASTPTEKKITMGSLKSPAATESSKENENNDANEVWIKKLDKNTNRYYWYNKNTKQSSWYPPA